MVKIKKREITIFEDKGAFSIFKKSDTKKSSFDFEGISVLRKVLSNEKARILHCIKYKKPSSLYELSKILGRSFKSVTDDLKVLERLGFVELIMEKRKNRIRHKPEIAIDVLTINFKI